MQRKDARFEQLDSRIVQAAGQRGNETLAAKLRDEQAEALKAIVELDMRLERDYPQYGELTNPKPLELAAAQKLLAADEALVLLLVSKDESFLWVLRRGDAGFFKLGIKRSELAEIVRKLRSQLDLDVPDPERLLRQVHSLRNQPQIGRLGRIDGTRELVHPRYPYIVAYRIVREDAEILAVRHTSRHWPEQID